MKGFLILCHNPTNLVSKGIRLVTRSYWNHSAILYNGYVYEFTDVGKKKTKYSEWKYNGITRLESVDLQIDPDTVNGKYDFGVFVNEILFYITKFDFFTNRDNPDAWYCFEFCAYCMGLSNYWRYTGKDFESLPNCFNFKPLNI